MATIRNLDAVYNNRKSFYGKAKVKQDGDTITLVSYGTDIISIKNGKLNPLWDGYSMTTSRHIKEFFKQFYGVDVNKKHLKRYNLKK